MTNLAKITIKQLPTFLAVALLSFSSITDALAQDLQDHCPEGKFRGAASSLQQNTNESGLSDARTNDRSKAAGSLSALHGFVSRGDLDLNHDTTLDGRGPIQSSPVSDGDHCSRLFLSPFVAPGAFKHWMHAAHPEFNYSSPKSDPSALLQITGDHEKLPSENHLFGIRCRNIALQNLETAISGNSNVLTKVLVSHCGCSCRTSSVESRIQIVRDFVNNGGYLLLMGEDIGSVEQLFPGFIAISNPGDNVSGGSEYLYDAALVKPDPVIGNRVVTNGLWLLNDNPSIKVLKPDLVRVICRSNKLAHERPDGDGVLSALFTFGRGYVMCIAGSLQNNPGTIFTKHCTISCFRNQLPDAARKIHIAMRQALAGNFIEAGLTRSRIPMQ